MSWGGRVAIVVLSAAGAWTAFDQALRLQDRRWERESSSSPTPFYTWSLYASDGRQRLSTQNGPLKLVLDPFGVYRNLPNQKGPWFRINSRGYRGAEVDLRPGVRRIVLVGGSTAFGTGVGSDEETVAQGLERRLANTQVVNAAVIGYVSSDELNLLRRELLDLDPSLVIVFDGVNDYVATRLGNQVVNGPFLQMEASLWERRQIRRSPRAALGALHESLFPGIHERLGRLGRRAAPAVQTVGDAHEEYLTNRVRIYTENIARMAAVTRERGVSLLVLLQPERPHREDLRYYYERYGRFTRMIAANLAERGIDHLNLHEMTELGLAQLTDGIHLTAEGSEMVAERVARHVREKPWL